MLVILFHTMPGYFKQDIYCTSRPGNPPPLKAFISLIIIQSLKDHRQGKLAKI